MVVLEWIRSFPHRWKTFVANRVAHIYRIGFRQIVGVMSMWILEVVCKRSCCHARFSGRDQSLYVNK